MSASAAMWSAFSPRRASTAFFCSSRRRHTRWNCDWSSDVCSSDLKQLTTDVRPEPNGNRREVLVYQRLLAGGRFGAPGVYASVFDEDCGRFWLFLEDVGYLTLNHGDQEEWTASVLLLAKMHGEHLGCDAELRALNCLADHDASYYRAIAARARQNMVLAGDRQTLARYDALMRPFDALADELA